eukprot:NODE_4460_length_1164_cov_96.162344_g3943_i0.p1 GENE.NODE_4460_length_1164_cov_96.162344_g3943_i0~~NODE_4460_length_1164_cov_96.162344_g3943_i0.p1  ORF type:complete len:329 (+),score=76.58 NODE_4460_length_1164_cov_96.162344_g3943_i0:58-1044(+)
MLTILLLLCFGFAYGGYYLEQFTCGAAKNEQCSNVATSSGNVVCAGTSCPVSFTYTGPTGFYFKNKRFVRGADNSANMNPAQCTSYATPIDGQPINWAGSVTAQNCYFYKEDAAPPPPPPAVTYFLEQFTCGASKTEKCSNVATSSGNVVCAGTLCPVSFTYTGPTGFYFKNKKFVRDADNSANMNPAQCTSYATPIDGQPINWAGSVTAQNCYFYKEAVAAPPTPPPPSEKVYFTEQNTCGPAKNQKCSIPGIVSGNVMCGGDNCPQSFTYTGSVGYYFKGRTLRRGADGSANMNPWQCTSAAKPIESSYSIQWVGSVTSKNCYSYS